MQTFKGVVQKGQERGRALGYPTANILLADKDISGIYAARVSIKGGERYMAAAFANPAREVLEAHLLDFSDDLYGQEVTIELYRKLRDSQCFDTDTLLRQAIECDVRNVRDYFNQD